MYCIGSCWSTCPRSFTFPDFHNSVFVKLDYIAKYRMSEVSVQWTLSMIYNIVCVMYTMDSVYTLHSCLNNLFMYYAMYNIHNTVYIYKRLHVIHADTGINIL